MRKRRATAGRKASTAAAMAAVAPAPTIAETVNRYRGWSVSERVNAAERSAPVTKPNWTALVSHAVSPAVSPHAAASSGAAAVALNQSDMTSSSPTATTANTRHRRAGGSVPSAPGVVSDATVDAVRSDMAETYAHRLQNPASSGRQSVARQR